MTGVYEMLNERDEDAIRGVYGAMQAGAEG